MGHFILFVIDGLLGLLEVAIILWALLSWLVAFNVMNYRHPVVRQIETVLEAVTRPVLAPFRRIIPTLGAVDISPIVALLVIEGARIYLLPWLFGFLFPIIG